jgi:hypothetical protein
MKEEFDARYPAIFQPGGDGEPQAAEQAPVHVDRTQSNFIRVPAVTAPAGTDAGAERRLAADAGMPEAARAAGTSVAAAHRPRRSWVPAVVVAVLMLAVGVFGMTAQYWLPAARTSNPADYHGLIMEPWGHVSYMAAPAFLVGGFSIAAAMLFLASRRAGRAELVYRLALGLLGALVAAAGFVALFANFLFPEALELGPLEDQSASPNLPWTYAVMPSGVSLLTLGLLVLAVLLVVPRLRQSGGREPWATLREGRVRAAWLGAVCLACGTGAMMAPYLFPLSTGSRTVELANGGTAEMQSWVNQAGILMPSLLLAGVIAVAWATILPVVAPTVAPPAEPGLDAVEL